MRSSVNGDRATYAGATPGVARAVDTDLGRLIDAATDGLRVSADAAATGNAALPATATLPYGIEETLFGPAGLASTTPAAIDASHALSPVLGGTRATTTTGAATVAAIAGITDPQAAQQWHLAKLGDIATVWKDYTGAGVKVGVYDSGVQYDHWDLAPNYDAGLHVTIDGYTYDGDYVPASGPHGTSVAGLIAAAKNGKGTVGVAYDATLGSVNIFDPYSGGGLNPGIFINADDDRLFLEAMRQGSKFDVTNHSWGATTPLYASQFSRGVEGTSAWKLTQAVTYVAENGRGGLGTIQVTAAGNNSVDMQGDASHTDRHFIAVGAYREVDGLASNYSSRGAGLLVSAPSNDLAIIGGTGVVATDLLGRDGYNLATDPGGKRDYTDQFGGTSAASPIAAGVVTLMIDANDQLGWRDVSNILAHSATLPIPFDKQQRYLEYTDADGTGQARMNESRFVVVGAGNNQSNGGGLHYSTDYGYGAINAYNAVRMAEVWSLFGAAKTSANEVHYESKTFSPEITSGGNPDIDFATAWDTFTGKQVGYSFEITDAKLDLEHVDMTINYTGLIDFSAAGIPGLTEYYLGSTRLRLTAPDGTSAFVDTLQAQGPYSKDEQSFTFGFANFRGANPLGTWTLELEASNNAVITVHDVKLDLYGAQPTANDVFTYTDEFFAMAAVAGQAGRKVLTDSDGGTDWINAAAVSKDVVISLSEGTTSTFGGVDAFRIAKGSAIENVVSGDGNDTLFGNALANELRGMRGNDTLVGGAGNDRLYGGAGDDTLNGGTGADLLDGGVGNDTYVVDNARDTVIESASGGIDSVYASVDYTLTANVETLYLNGGARIGTGNALDNSLYGTGGNDTLYGLDGNDTLRGGAGDDRLYGGAGRDTLIGHEGNDWLDGGAGADTMEGGAGNDIYYVDDAGDRIIEYVQNGAGGTDTVYASVDWTLGANIENLFLTGSANLNGTGNALANTLRGNTGANVLIGGAGNDILIGLGGNDTLFGGAGGDTFVFAAGSGKDTIGDFGRGDVIDLSGYQLDTAPLVTDLGSATLIDLGNGNTITLVDIDPAQLTFTGNAFGFAG